LKQKSSASANIPQERGAGRQKVFSFLNNRCFDLKDASSNAKQRLVIRFHAQSSMFDDHMYAQILSAS